MRKKNIKTIMEITIKKKINATWREPCTKRMRILLRNYIKKFGSQAHTRTMMRQIFCNIRSLKIALLGIKEARKP